MGPCVAYCVCSRVGSVAVAVPAPTICFAPLSIVTAETVVMLSDVTRLTGLWMHPGVETTVTHCTLNTVASFPDVRVQSRALYSYALRAVGCCVMLCFHRPGARWVLRAVAGCSGPCSCASVLCCWSALVGQLSVLECAFWGFPHYYTYSHYCVCNNIEYSSTRKS